MAEVISPTIAPDEKGCYGWPRACEHFDDLDCTLAEEMQNPEFAVAYHAAEVRFERQFPGYNKPAPVKRNRRRGWRR